MYSTVGTNTITHSQFVSSSPNSKVSGSFTGGGGLYIEFAPEIRNISELETILTQVYQSCFLKIEEGCRDGNHE